MDGEDGRTVLVPGQSGHCDAPRDALTGSLRAATAFHSAHSVKKTAQEQAFAACADFALRAMPDCTKTGPQQEGEER